MPWSGPIFIHRFKAYLLMLRASFIGSISIVAGWNIPYMKVKRAGKIGNPRIRRILFHCHVWLPEGISMNIPLFYIIITFYPQNPVLPGTFRDRKGVSRFQVLPNSLGESLLGEDARFDRCAEGRYQPQRSPPRKQYWLVVTGTAIMVVNNG